MRTLSYNTLVLVLFCVISASGQIYKNVVVEHFTNTYCSVCAARNPGFYTNLSNHPQVIHISFHPSSPYPQCPLNQQNKIENDDRTKFYGVYGPTPRLVIQGEVKPSTASYSDPALFTPYFNQAASFSISVQQVEIDDSVQVTVRVTRVASSDSLKEALLFAGVVSDTLSFTGNNGETLQQDVFRKSLTKATGDSLLLPATVSTSILLNFKTGLKANWNKKTLYVVALLQNSSTKQVLNAAVTAPGEGLKTFLPATPADEGLLACYPNPFSDYLRFSYRPGVTLSLRMYNSQGILMKDEQLDSGSQLDLNAFPKGLYYIQVRTGESTYTFRRVKQ